MNDRGPLLEGMDLRKHYRMGGEELRVLRGIQIRVHSGEWIAILGASGSGKSTLLHLLGGLDRPTEGTVQFEGRNVFRMTQMSSDRYRSHKVGFVFQFYHLLPELTALENVVIAAMIRTSIISWPAKRSGIRRRATDLLEQLGVGGRLRHRPNKLSGGERQRVAIARALMNQPRLLLADEPTGNLDTDAGKQILEVLGRLHEQGQTIILVTHDERVAAAADRRLCLVDGRLAEVD